MVELESEVLKASSFFTPSAVLRSAIPEFEWSWMMVGIFIVSGGSIRCLVEPSNPWMAGNASLFTRVLSPVPVRLQPGVNANGSKLWDAEQDLQTAFDAAEEFPTRGMGHERDGVKGAPADLIMIGSSQRLIADPKILNRGFERPAPTIRRGGKGSSSNKVGRLTDRAAWFDTPDPSPCIRTPVP